VVWGMFCADSAANRPSRSKALVPVANSDLSAQEKIGWYGTPIRLALELFDELFLCSLCGL
jgi:hypothetical protein